MKIYFEDGILLRNLKLLPEFPDYTLDASTGVKHNRDVLEHLLNNPEHFKILYTNSILAFHNTYAWNEKLEVPEIYIRSGKDGEFIRIDELTNRELREGHNLGKMYIAGEFAQ